MKAPKVVFEELRISGEDDRLRMNYHKRLRMKYQIKNGEGTENEVRRTAEVRLV